MSEQPCDNDHLSYFEGCHSCAFNFPDALAARCTEIADKVVPQYRDKRPGSPVYSCGGHIAKLWQAAWDGACVALGGDPKAFIR